MNDLFILIHVVTVFESCVNPEQVDNAFRWGCRVIKNLDDKNWFIKLVSGSLSDETVQNKLYARALTEAR